MQGQASQSLPIIHGWLSTVILELYACKKWPALPRHASCRCAAFAGTLWLQLRCAFCSGRHHTSTTIMVSRVYEGTYWQRWLHL